MSRPAKTTWLVRLSPETEAFLLLQHRLGVHQSEARHLLSTYQREHRLSTWLPNLAGLVAFFAWMFAFGRVTDYLDDIGYDTADLLDYGWPGLLAALLMGYGAAIALATIVYVLLQRRLLLRPIRRCIDTPACYACDHSLQGVPHENNRATCPECGQSTPVPSAQQGGSSIGRC